MKFYAIPSLAGLSKQGGLLSVFEGIEGIFKFLAVPGARRGPVSVTTNVGARRVPPKGSSSPHR